VADPDAAVQWLEDEFLGKVAKLSFGPAASDPTALQSGNASAIIASILKAPQSID
jgi:hypothetical protein